MTPNWSSNYSLPILFELDKLVLTYLPKVSSVSGYLANFINSLLSSDGKETHIIFVYCTGRHTCLFHKHKRASQREMKRSPDW